MRPRRLLPLLAVLVGPLAHAQVVLYPGHPDLATEGLSLVDHLLRVHVTEPRAIDVGTVSFSVQDSGGTVTMQTVSEARDVGLGGTVTSILAWPSLRPIATERGRTSRALYDGARMTGVYGSGDWDPLPYDLTLASQPFQPEVLPLLARMLPFRDGYRATVPTFSAGSRLREFTLSVTGPESFNRTDGTTATVWAVEETSALFQGRARRYLVDATTRDLVATTFAPQPGSTVVIEPTTEAEQAARTEAERGGRPLRPGDDGLAAEALTSYEREYQVQIVAPEAQDAGTQTLSVTIDHAAGTVTVRTVLDLTPLDEPRRVETATALFPSLRPVSRRTETSGVASDLVYSETEVAGQFPDGDHVEIALSDPVFDHTFLPIVASVLPFEPEYRVQFETVGQDGPMAVQLTVMEAGTVADRPVWFVSARSGEGGPTVYAVDAETRQIVRTVLEPMVGVVVHFTPAGE